MDVRATKITGLEQLWIARVRAEKAREASARTSDETTRVAISPRADLLGQLSSLKHSDPDKFREVLGSVSANLTAAANPQSGRVGSDLSALARTLDDVAKTGDLSRLGDLSPASPRAEHRAIEAYLRNARPVVQHPTDTSKQALQYVLSAITEANRDIAPAAAARAATR